MESNKNGDIKNLMGVKSEYKTEIYESENESDFDGEKGKGNFTEKLKSLLSAKYYYPKTTIEISKVLDEIKLNMNYSALKSKKLEPNKMNEITGQINKYFEKETKIDIDSIFPFINGKQINNFFKKVDKFSYPKEIQVNEDKDYTVIVESTFSLKSQIIKKSEQIKKAFILFSLLHNFYQIYPEYLEEYYKLFIKNYFKKNESDDFDLSSCGNYVFLIVTNKEFKSFKEKEEFTINLCNDKNSINISLEKDLKKININKKQKQKKVNNNNLKNVKNKNTININSKNAVQKKSNKNVKTPSEQAIHFKTKKRLEIRIKVNKKINGKIIKNNNNILNIKNDKAYKSTIKTKISQKTIGNFSPFNIPSKTFKEDKLEEINKKLWNNINCLNAYQKLNYLIEKINKEEKCKVKLLYIDVDSFFETPQCPIMQKLEEINKRLIDSIRILKNDK